jgi:hypothetical protein
VYSCVMPHNDNFFLETQCYFLSTFINYIEEKDFQKLYLVLNKRLARVVDDKHAL